MAVRVANQTMDCEQLSGCYGTDKKDNGGGGDDMAKTPGEQKTMLEYNAERDGQHQVVAAPKKQQRPSFRHFMIEAPFLEPPKTCCWPVMSLVYDELACFFFWLSPQGAYPFIQCEFGNQPQNWPKAKVVGVFLMLLSVGQASPVKDLSAAGEPLGKSGTSAKNEEPPILDGSSAWWIWALILLAFAAVLLLGIGGAFAYWKW
uniref:Uncharacterized protein n=1 Tax=Globodera pallida TaxID=36090 RepID=A0A183BNF4_GLOPA